MAHRFLRLVVLGAVVAAAEPITVRTGQSSCGAYEPNTYEYACYPGVTYAWEYHGNQFELTARGEMAPGLPNEWRRGQVHLDFALTTPVPLSDAVSVLFTITLQTEWNPFSSATVNGDPNGYMSTGHLHLIDLMLDARYNYDGVTADVTTKLTASAILYDWNTGSITPVPVQLRGADPPPLIDPGGGQTGGVSTSTPEPAAWQLFAVGAAALAHRARKQSA